MPLPIDDYLEVLRREGDALAAAAEGRLDAEVPSCPGWRVADLVWHTGDVHYSWAAVAETPSLAEPGYAQPERPADADLLGWYRSQLDRLARVLAEADPDAPTWTWTGPQTLAWIIRRMAQETAVHRRDAEAAGAAPVPIDPDLAVDGIDEFLEFFLNGTGELEGTVHLHATDAEGEWLIRLTPGRPPAIERGHAKGDVAVRGPSSDLLLLLWRRRSLDGLEVFGDAALAEAFVSAPNLE